MIYCIWYPSGGFGHFVNALLCVYGNNFVSNSDSIVFSNDGNSHEFPLTLPKYNNKKHNLYDLSFVNETQNYTVLVDNGIDDESCDFLHHFPDSNVIKMCYSDVTWPVVAKTYITKAMNSNLNEEISVDQESWPANEQWAQREKFFLFLRDHEFKNYWKPDNNTLNLLVDDLMNYNQFVDSMQEINLPLNDFSEVYNKWWNSNKKYFDSVIVAQDVINAINTGQAKSLLQVNDVWTQAVVYYFIWLHFGVEVSHNDFSDFFEDTDQIKQWLNV